MRRPSAATLMPMTYLLLTMTLVAAVRPMVSYRALELGATASTVGLIAGAYAFVAVALAVPLGRIADRFGSPPMMLAGGLGLAASTLSLGYLNNLAILTASQAMLGLAFLMAQVGQQTLFARTVAAHNRDAVFGALGVIGSFAQMGGPLLAGVIVASSGNGLSHVFVFGASLAAFASVIAAVLSARWRKTPGPAATQETPASNPASSRSDGGPASSMDILRIGGVPRAMLISFATMATIDMLVVYLPVYGEANDIPVATITTLLAVRAGTSMLSRAAMSALVSGLGRKRLLVLGTLTPGIALLLLPFTSLTSTLFVLIAIAGFFLGLGQPLTLVWVINQVPAQVRGAALGLRMSGNKLVQLIVPVVIGAAASRFGVGIAFYIMGATLGASTFALHGLSIDETP